ncbi:MAG: energy transducer TonB [Ignavibacteriaceae bacterium]
MALRKSPKADLRRQYRKFVEISFIVSLALLILAFKFFPNIKESKVIEQAPQQLINLKDIQQTTQETRPPPPPKPEIPIAVPSEDVLNDVTLQSTELNQNANVAPPPPPKEEKKVDEGPQYFVAVENMPEPIGGIAAIQSKIVYPSIAKRAGVEGTVYIKAYVNKKGVVTKAVVLKGIGAGCDQAALKAVEETKFSPGSQRGKPVNVMVSIPVVFRLK